MIEKWNIMIVLCFFFVDSDDLFGTQLWLHFQRICGRIRCNATMCGRISASLNQNKHFHAIVHLNVSVYMESCTFLVLSILWTICNTHIYAYMLLRIQFIIRISFFSMPRKWLASNASIFAWNMFPLCADVVVRRRLIDA